MVDNASPDHSVALLREKNFGRFQLLLNPENRGYAGGMNFGINQALADGADWLWLITQDITVEPNALKTLMDLWPKLDNPGMLGSLTDLNATEKIYFYRAFIENGQVRHKTKGRSIPEIPELRQEFGVTDYVNGACIFTHRSVIEKTGFIPEEYFMYFEDCEWGLRASRLGFNNYVSYCSRAHHWRESESFNPSAEYYCRRNSFLFKARNGFGKPWTKTLELARLYKLLFKFKIKSALGSKDVNIGKLIPILKEAASDLHSERFGKRHSNQ